MGISLLFFQNNKKNLFFYLLLSCRLRSLRFRDPASLRLDSPAMTLKLEKLSNLYGLGSPPPLPQFVSPVVPTCFLMELLSLVSTTAGLPTWAPLSSHLEPGGVTQVCNPITLETGEQNHELKVHLAHLLILSPNKQSTSK